MIIMKMKIIFINQTMEQILFKQFIKSQGLRQSSQRDRVVETFLSLRGHISAEELLNQVRKKELRVGLTTVYRTLKLLTECGLAVERKFNSQVTVFEPNRVGQHHDHLICLECGRIMEFENKTIETLQEAVARDHSFIITHHILDLYGHCAACRKTRKKKN
jgi:Fur family transcriptional regulator, ferric uptake regulator